MPQIHHQHDAAIYRDVAMLVRYTQKGLYNIGPHIVICIVSLSTYLRNAHFRSPHKRDHIDDTYSDDEEYDSQSSKRHRRHDNTNVTMKKNQNDPADTDVAVVRIPPYHYVHVLDQTTNVTRVEIGPQTFVRKDNEKVLMGATKMVIVPPRHFCIIKNPVVRDDDGEIVKDVLGQIKLFHADLEIRLSQDPFPLYPGEELEAGIKPLQVVAAMTALRLRVTRDFKDGDTNRLAGDEVLFEGPGTYLPRKEVDIASIIKAEVIRLNEALKLRAVRSCVDRDGKNRVAGEEWLVRRAGDYLPGAYEEVVERCAATVSHFV